MASLISSTLTSDYRGIESIFQFTNWDGEYVPYNCGQAAAATLLTFLGKYKPDPQRAEEIMQMIEAEHPPDNLGGYLGTSRRRVERILRANGVRFEVVRGESRLRDHLGSGRPVLVMCQVPGKRWKRWTIPSGHWMVASGFDDQALHLTNWGRMNWVEFRERWQALVPRLISMRCIGLAAI